MGRRISRFHFYEGSRGFDQDHKFNKKGQYFPLHYRKKGRSERQKKINNTQQFYIEERVECDHIKK